MRKFTKKKVKEYIKKLNLNGKVLEIGGHRLEKCAIKLFNSKKFQYYDLNITESNIPNTIIADICDCKKEIPANEFDIVFSSDVMEHIERPWLAAEEITRILKPGGIAMIFTLWAWRYHPCPRDYWRFSNECLKFLFHELECFEAGYDLSERRKDRRGFWPNGKDAVPVDRFGGWRENWAVYFIGQKRHL